ncbi:MAG: hypothetical protein CM1200mP26_23190 [Acidimicrobiales bacterium]|nr:MAG: hypothetical protein CM1200mP26_23190 [Acidimicrobiales bacterium]
MFSSGPALTTPSGSTGRFRPTNGCSTTTGRRARQRPGIGRGRGVRPIGHPRGHRGPGGADPRAHSLSRPDLSEPLVRSSASFVGPERRCPVASSSHRRVRLPTMVPPIRPLTRSAARLVAALQCSSTCGATTFQLTPSGSTFRPSTSSESRPTVRFPMGWLGAHASPRPPLPGTFRRCWHEESSGSIRWVRVSTTSRWTSWETER